ncbi:SPOR domain-containing protein [Paracoccus jeotgali]|uniref:SPOR domain-containing protein n=1 Tax=Paracoccus jeotgali TaxID=2065379 RepID=UPI0028ADAB97|nr:SPOR domain-containing protein [Paracoccus jeotgali]
MAVTDFGAGRIVDSEARQGRAYAYQHRAQDDYDDDYGWYDEDGLTDPMQPETLGARMGRVTKYLGAIVSVGLMIGLVVWGYKLVARDVSGVPVIRAVEGESRTTPEEPGGELARNGGLTVNEVAAGVAMPPNAEIAIAPAPTALTEDDIAMGELADVAGLAAPAAEPAPPLAAAPVVAMTDAETAANPDGHPTDLAALGIVTAEDLAAAAGENPMEATLSDAEIALTPVPAAAGPRPAPRPASIAARAAAAPAAAPAAAEQRPAIEAAVAEAVAEPEAEPEPEPQRASVPAGAPVVQLGAFDSGSIADSEWGRISNRFSSMFAGKSQVVQTTVKNGRTFYRLRVAGFESRDDARRFCAALLAEGADCIATQQ